MWNTLILILLDLLRSYSLALFYSQALCVSVLFPGNSFRLGKCNWIGFLYLKFACEIVVKIIAKDHHASVGHVMFFTGRVGFLSNGSP